MSRFPSLISDLRRCRCHTPGKGALLPGLLAVILVSGGLTVARAAGPIYWDWPTVQPFTDVELDGAAVDRNGHLAAGLARLAGHLADQDVVWKIAPDGQGGFYSGTGHIGGLYRTDADGDSRLVCRLEGTEIFSLLVMPDGSLIVGCGPEGQVYRVDEDGTATQLGTLPGGYVWAMVPGTDPAEVWLAGGSPAAVYRLDKEQQPQLVAELPAQNCLDLISDGRDGLLAVTQGPGLLYRLAAGNEARPELLFEAPQEELRQFVPGPDGDLFMLALHTAEAGAQETKVNGRAVPPGQPRPNGLLFGDDDSPHVAPAALYRLTDDGRVTTWWTGDKDLMITAWSERLGWLAGGPLPADGDQAVLWRLLPPAGEHPVAGWSGGDILDLVVVPGDKAADERLLVGQAHPGGVGVFGLTHRKRPAALSPPLDAGVQVRWGRLCWQGDAGDGRLRWSVRTGNRSVPDESWSDWTSTWSDTDHELDLPPSRFLQWRVEFPDGDDASGWRVTAVSVSAWEDNLPPVIARFERERVAQVDLGGLMPSGKNVTQTLRSGLRLEFNKASQQDRRATGRRAARTRPVHTFSWAGNDPNEDRLLYDLAYRRRGDDTWRSIVEDTPEQVGSWDTSDVPDGRYEVQVTVSDGPDNPPQLTLSSSRTLGPVMVDNTAPVIEDFEVTATDDGFRVAFAAEDQTSPLAGATLLLPDGRRQRLDPVDLICDSRKERFEADITWPRPGAVPGTRPWLIRVEVEDLAGNLAVAEGTAR